MHVIIQNILSYIPKIGRPIKETAGIIERFLDFRNDIKKGEESIIDEYLSRIKENRLDESDSITKLIGEKILEVKKQKESVLIIEDLDRIDPEHIFRILNVFGAHYEKGSIDQHKFGFDKVILVGDYLNFKNIFHHKFGLNTDFSGYISKFYSTEIFYYDNNINLSNILENIITNIKTDELKEFFSGRNPFDYNYYSTFMIIDIIKAHIDFFPNELIDLRRLIGINEFELLKFKNIDFKSNLNVFDIAIFVLEFIFDNKDKLINKINYIKNNFTIKSHENYIPRTYSRVLEHILNDFYSNDNEKILQDNSINFEKNSLGEINIKEKNNYMLKRFYYEILAKYIDDITI